jgi:Xaa-Pro aminopeptidase
MTPPFTAGKLDALMDEAGMDVLLATSKENVQYLLGGYKSPLFAYKDSIGVSRFQPCVGYVKGAPEKSFYVGCPLDNWQQAVEPAFWIQNISNSSFHCEQTGKEVAEFIQRLGLAGRTVGIERSFMPVDCFAVLQSKLPTAKFVETHPLLDELRAVKRPDELALLKEGSELIIDSLLTVMGSSQAGTTTQEIAERVRREEVTRGLNFEYCLVCTGPSYNRAPSNVRWEKGNILSLDSGGNKNGYLGDLCRMAVMGPPTPLMKDLLAEIQAVQSAARTAVRAGVTGNEIFEKALDEQAKCHHKDEMGFFAHGMGMIQHEAPHLTSKGAIPYAGRYENRPLQPGMVLSIETDLKNPVVGFVKLEDTVVVTPNGSEAFGDRGRDWNVVQG